MILGTCLFCKKEFHKRRNIYKFCSLICSNRNNLNGLNKVKLPEKNILLAEFIGICLGDGYVSQYQIAITLNSIADQEYIPYIVNLATKLFTGATVSLIPRKTEGATDVRINSSIAANFLRDMGMIPNAKTIPSWILSNQAFSYACVRGLFDTEGSISFKQYQSKKGITIYKQLNFRNADVKLMQFVRDNLINLGLKPTMTLKRSLYLSNNKSIDKYIQVIGFSNPKLFRKSLPKDIDTYNEFKRSSTASLSKFS